jgi:hypothetical protein
MGTVLKAVNYTVSKIPCNNNDEVSHIDEAYFCDEVTHRLQSSVQVITRLTSAEAQYC